MGFEKNSRGEISLSYLFKLGFVSFVALCINATFDFISGSIYTYKVQLITSSPLVRDVKQCVYDTIMNGSYLSLPDCSESGSYRLRQPERPLDVSIDGVISLKETINSTEVELKLTPSFLGDGHVTWLCLSNTEKYLPDNCTLNRH